MQKYQCTIWFVEGLASFNNCCVVHDKNILWDEKFCMYVNNLSHQINEMNKCSMWRNVFILGMLFYEVIQLKYPNKNNWCWLRWCPHYMFYPTHFFVFLRGGQNPFSTCTSILLKINGQYSSLPLLSFHPDKTVTSNAEAACINSHTDWSHLQDWQEKG